MVIITAKIKTDTPITTSTTLNDLETVFIASLKSAEEIPSIYDQPRLLRKFSDGDDIKQFHLFSHHFVRKQNTVQITILIEILPV
jgi:hypothetical protein